jgi:P63C domain
MTIQSHYKAPLKQLGPDVDGYVLDELDGEKQRRPRCVLSKRGAANALGLKSEGGSALLRTLTRKGIGSEMSHSLREKIENPIVFKYIDTGSESAESATGKTVHGYETGTFVEILRLILVSKLTKTQKFLADRAAAMLISLANTTLDAIVYQESGFWTAIEGQRVSEILDQYLQDHARKWAKTFPDEFWVKLIRVKGYPSYFALKRPAFVGHWVNDIVYDRLVPGAKKRLNEINPRLPSGRRKNANHQYTTEDHGLPELKGHLIKVMAYMDAAANDNQFMRMLNRGTPRFGDTYEMPLDDIYRH